MGVTLRLALTLAEGLTEGEELAVELCVAVTDGVTLGEALTLAPVSEGEGLDEAVMLEESETQEHV